MNASIVELHGVPGIADMFDQYPVILIIVRYIVYALGKATYMFRYFGRFIA